MQSSHHDLPGGCTHRYCFLLTQPVIQIYIYIFNEGGAYSLKYQSKVLEYWPIVPDKQRTDVTFYSILEWVLMFLYSLGIRVEVYWMGM